MVAYLEYEQAIRDAGIPFEEGFCGGYNPFSLLVDTCQKGDMEEQWRWHKELDRWAFVNRFGFAIPNKEALEAIKPYSPILEVGAGCGYWSYELIRAGVEVIATDKEANQNEALSGYLARVRYSRQWYPVKPLDGVEATDRYGDTHALLIIWPCYDKDWAAQVLEKYPGKTFLYVGEVGGCCANDRFFSLLEREWEEVRVVDIPQWYGIHDYLTIYQRKP